MACIVHSPRQGCPLQKYAMPMPLRPTDAPPPSPPPGASPWLDIVQQLGAAVAGPLSSAMERIQHLISTGQIDREGLRALRESVGLAREAGMVSQQLARLGSGRLRLAHERLPLTQVLRHVLTHRSRETQARGVQIRHTLTTVAVMTDGALLFALINAVLDWALACTHSSIDLKLDLSPWPPKARLQCRFAHRSLDLMDDPHPHSEPPALRGLSWRLVELTALTLGLPTRREGEAGISTLTLEFPHTVLDEGSPVVDVERTRRARDYPLSGNSKPLAGSHLLLLSPDPMWREAVRRSVRQMGVIVDGVAQVEEARQFIAEGLPHALIFQQRARDPEFASLLSEIRQDSKDFCFVEVMLDNVPTQLSSACPDGVARVARVSLDEALPSVLMFEMAKSH